jgi:hypothetical protein
VPTELDGTATIASLTILKCGAEGSGNAGRTRLAFWGNGSTGDEVGEVSNVAVLDVRAENRLVEEEDEVDATETGDNKRVYRGDALMGVLDPKAPSDWSRRGRECERERGATWIGGRARLDEEDRLEDEAI